MTTVDIPRSIFRAYDIRGRAEGSDAPLTSQLAYRVGCAYAQRLRRGPSPTGRVVVGGDQRTSTPSLMRSLIEGVLDSGVDVVDIGRATSPLVYWSAARLDQERPTAGAVITASHNPPEDNGIKLLEPGGMPLRPESIQEVADAIESGQMRARGSGERSFWDPKPDYWRELGDAHQLTRAFPVAIDPGNGVAALTAPGALTAIGAEVIAINDDPDEPNPPHPADPQHASNVTQLAALVRDSNAELGFAFDGDGDRLGLVDGRGWRVPPDQVLALLAEDWLAQHPGAVIQVDVKSSLAVCEHIERLGGRPAFGPVGHSLGKYAMQERGISFGGEASTHYFYRLSDPPHISDDAVRTACRIAQVAATTKLEEILDQIPRFHTSPEVKIACADDRKHEVAAALVRRCRERWPVNEIDGARIDLDAEVDGAWCLIRASNTTPALTVVVEGRDEHGYEAALRIAADLLAEQGLDPTPLINQPPLQ